MDCQHIQQNELHEKYLLAQLEESEKSGYEKHIETCSSCREELAKQKTMIAGIQAAGREEMKQQLRKQVKELREQEFTSGSKWQMILKIAAVLFVIAMIPSAIYYFRTDSGQPVAKLLIPESLPVREKSVQEDKQAKGKEEEKKPAAAGETSEEGTLLELHPSESAQSHPPETSFAPEMQSNESASGGAGAGYGAAKVDTKRPTIIMNPESTGEPIMDQIQSMPRAPDEYGDKLLSMLAGGVRYKFAEGESVAEEPVRFETGKTTAKEYDALNSQNFARDFRTGKQTNIKKAMPPIPKAVFKSGQKIIRVNFLTSNGRAALEGEDQLPESFKVDMVNRDSLNWEMNWYVENSFLRYDPSQMEIVFKGEILYVIIPKNNVFRIAANADTTKAVLLTK